MAEEPGRVCEGIGGIEVEEKKKHLAVKMAETMVIGANEDLGVTQEYNRQNRSKLWDSKEAKSA